jgi:hypothetical protein
MKTYLRLSLGLAVIGTLGTTAVLPAAGRSLEMVVVAERTDAQVSQTVPSPGLPVSYVALDGGYIEAGDPVANEHPPGAAAMAQALQRELSSLSYEPASGAATPSLALIYHWGRLYRDSHEVRNGTLIDPNLHARLSLLTTSRQDREIESFVLDRQLTGRINPAFRSSLVLTIQERDALELARDDRYIAVLSAYDYRSVSERQPKLLWRVKMSTLNVGASMADALPTLLHGGAPYLGSNLGGFESLKVPLVTAAEPVPGPAVERFSPPLGNTGSLDGQFLRSLMKLEHDEFSGAHVYDKVAYEPIVAPGSIDAASPVQDVPPKTNGTL